MKKLILSILIATISVSANPQGKKLYAKCAGCHGDNGQKKALGKSDLLVGKSRALLEKEMNGYKMGILNMHGLGGMKRELMRDYTQKEISNMAQHIESFTEK